MPEMVLATKLYVPPVRTGLVARPRLDDRLAQAVSRPLTLVCAPAGYGKSTLVATGLATLAQQAGVAWLSLDEEDNDPVRFWVYVTAALRRVAPGVGDRAQALLHSPQPAPLPVVLTFLINDLAARPEPLVLVLDDYHTITHPAIHDSLTYLLEYLPPSLHLLLTSRVDPPLPLARLRAGGDLHEVRAADLRFSVEETAAFLQDVMDLPLAAEAVRTLEERTEGWIAGLQLAALSMQGVDNLPAFVQAFGGSQRHLVDYLTEEVLARQPEAIQQFLLHTGVLDRFCASLCDAVLQADGEPLTGAGSAQELLEELERANLFLVPLDGERRWYRYHHLFADLLRFRARQILTPDQLRCVHRRAALWFEAAGLWGEAIQEAIAGEAYDVAGRIVGQQAAPAATRGEVASLAEWLAGLPAVQVDGDARLKLAQAWVSTWFSLVTAGPHPADEQLQQAMILLDSSELAGNQALLGEALAIRATLALVRNDATQNIADSERALALLPEPYRPLRSLVAWHLAFSYRSCGQADHAVRAYEQAIDWSEKGGSVVINFSARRELADLLFGRGELHRAEAMLVQLLEEATSGGWETLYPVSAACVHLGEIHYERNLLESAAAYVQKGLSLRNVEFMSFDAYGFALLGQIYAAQGDTQSAAEAIEEAEQRVRQASHAQRRAHTLARIARYWLRQGDVVEAASWLPDGYLLPQDPRHEVACRQQISHARYYLATGETAAARRIVAELIEPAAGSGRLRDSVELRLLEARLLTGERAVAAVRDALLLAEPAGLVRTFLDEGLPIGRLLQQLQGQKGLPAAYLARLLAAFAGGEPGFASQPLVEPLSERELEVLRLAAQGRSNKEIAQALVFTVGTAKKHMEHILGKLGASNRTEAVARARELQLL